MTAAIVACGQSAESWTKSDFNIGCNDAYKWGTKFDALVICNHKAKFTPERIDIIVRTNPVKLYTNCLSWEPYFPDMNMVRLRSWDGLLKKEEVLRSTTTSPFIAMSLAYNLGATKMILWGVDFQNHWSMNPNNPELKMELRQYRQFVDALGEQGIDVRLGTKGSMLEEFIKIND